MLGTALTQALISIFTRWDNIGSLHTFACAAIAGHVLKLTPFANEECLWISFTPDRRFHRELLGL